MPSIALRKQTKSGEVTVLLDDDGNVQRLERLASGTLLSDEWSIEPQRAERLVSELLQQPPRPVHSQGRWSFAAMKHGGPPDFEPVESPETAADVSPYRDLVALLEVPEPEPAFPEKKTDARKIEFNHESLIVAWFLVAASIAMILYRPLGLHQHSQQFSNHFDNMILAWLASGVPPVIAFSPLFAVAGLLAGKFAARNPTKVARNGAFHALVVGFYFCLIPPATLLVLPLIAQGCAWIVARRREDLSEPPPESETATQI